MSNLIVWLLLVVSPNGLVDIEGPLRADICEERIVYMNEVSLQSWGIPYNAQCINSQQPWRRIYPTGPNEQELLARKRNK